MPRPIAFDVTHLVSRLPVTRPSGIDKVDLAYARYLAAGPCSAAVHYGLFRAQVHPGERIRGLVTVATRARWAGTSLARDPAFHRVLAWLTGAAPPSRSERTPSPVLHSDDLIRRWTQVRWRLTPGRHPLPPGSIYLNVAQHAFEFPRFFSWLDRRPDVRAVFMLHDLLPLDYPEYFRPGYKSRFGRRIETVLRHASALVTASQAVAARIEWEFRSRGRRPVPIHVEHLPSSLPALLPAGEDTLGLRRIPYFLVLGTIEPRKNHLLLLEVWRRFARETSDPPKLIVVGARGWENEQVLDVLDRGRLTRPHVLEVDRLGDAALAALIGSARAILMPSFAEGYGLPVVEALTLGTPVIASDIPVFREISQGCALFRHPLDAPGWRGAIEALAVAAGEPARQAKAAAGSFRAPTWPGYFGSIEGFLRSL